MSSKIGTRSARKSSNSGRLQQCSKKRTAMPPATASIVQKITEKAENCWMIRYSFQKHNLGQHYNPVLTTVSVEGYCPAMKSRQLLSMTSAARWYSTVFSQRLLASCKVMRSDEHLAAFVRLFYSKFTPRTRLLLNLISLKFTRCVVHLQHWSWNGWELCPDRSGRRLGQSPAAQRWTARAVLFCSAPCWLVETKSPDPGMLRRPMQAPSRLQSVLEKSDPFDSITLKDSEEVLLFTFPGEDSLKT